MEDEPELDLLTITQLRQVAGPGAQPYRLHLQVDGCVEKQTSQGNPFLEIKLADGGDSLIWRIFDNNPCFAEARLLQRGAFLEISAQWVDSGKYGIEPRQARMRVLSDEERQTLLNGSGELAQRQHADYQDIEAFVEAICDPRLKTLSSVFLERFGERFKRTAAARENHHARRGGLVEHVAQMMRCAAAIASVYPALNRDLLIAGVLFHDCGKLWENSYPEAGFNMPYNINGEMLGHISLGLELVNKLWREMLERPEAVDWVMLEPASEMVRLHLLHLIAAHHGQYEFGSPVLPKTPEAVALHHVDNIDAKLEMFRRGYAASKEIGPGIFERFRPWPVNVVAPLPAVAPPPAVVQEAADEAAEITSP
ncbi:MAG TPA: HD domain-containing protein [Prosthecobacter sp.]|nr:HD domain-containing protein [Prosthecobacter sp.]